MAEKFALTRADVRGKRRFEQLRSVRTAETGEIAETQISGRRELLPALWGVRMLQRFAYASKGFPDQSSVAFFPSDYGSVHGDLLHGEPTPEARIDAVGVAEVCVHRSTRSSELSDYFHQVEVMSERMVQRPTKP